jgi:alpha-D-ribose 1-methylphosphonate 5-triphosphate synthase subunit PhnH
MSTTNLGNTPARLHPGFANPVDEAQQVFRQALNALANPGQVHNLQLSLQPIAGVAPAAAALLLALADYDTPVWLQQAQPELERWLPFHTGCPIMTNPADARFAWINQAADMPALSTFAQGQPEYPDQSATLIIQISLSDTACGTLTGPGIAEQQSLRVSGLPASFWADWQRQQARFPLGVDVFLVDGHSLIGLPRTSRFEPAGKEL